MAILNYGNLFLIGRHWKLYSICQALIHLGERQIMNITYNKTRTVPGNLGEAIQQKYPEGRQSCILFSH